MTVAIRATDVVAFLRGFYPTLDKEGLTEQNVTRELFKAVARHFHMITLDEVRHGLKAFYCELDAATEEAERENEGLRRAVAICERHDVPADMPMGQGLALAASRGDAEAAAILAKAEADAASAANRMREALAVAACKAHPAWSEDEDGFYLEEGRDGPVSDTDLIDWYQRTYPREAKAIEARFKG